MFVASCRKPEMDTTPFAHTSIDVWTPIDDKETDVCADAIQRRQGQERREAGE